MGFKSFDAKLILGYPWLGFGYIRCYPNEIDHYTMWTIFITSKFSIGIHLGGK